MTTCHSNVNLTLKYEQRTLNQKHNVHSLLLDIHALEIIRFASIALIITPKSAEYVEIIQEMGRWQTRAEQLNYSLISLNLSVYMQVSSTTHLCLCAISGASIVII